MKQLIEQIQKSIYNPEFYRTILTKPFSFTWIYFSGFTMLLALLLTIIFSIPLVSVVNNFLHGAPDKIMTYFPAELAVTITKGHVTVNQPEPYALAMPPEFRTATMTNLAVIDTKNPVTLDAFKAQHTAALVGEHQIIYMGNNNKVEISEIDPSLSMTIDHAQVTQWVEHVRPYTAYVSPILVICLFAGLLLYFGLRFAYMVFGALLILLLGRFALKQEWSYSASYQIGLHALTLPLLLQTIFMLLPIGFPSIPFFYTVIMLIMVYVNFKDPTAVTPSVSIAPNVPPTDPTV